MPDVRLEIKANVKVKVGAKGKLGVASEAWLALHEYFTSQKPRFEQIASDLGLTGMQAYALYLLGEPLSMGELAQRLNCDNSNVTGIVDRLESRGLIERRAAAEDRRVKLLVLTEKGERLRDEGVAKFTAPAAGIAALSTSEQRTLRDLLRKAIDVERTATGDGRTPRARPSA